jgi:hypothetical protein
VKLTDSLAIRTKALNRKITRPELRKLLWSALDRIEELEAALLTQAIIQNKPK